jgi:hypothetical protein
MTEGYTPRTGVQLERHKLQSLLNAIHLVITNRWHLYGLPPAVLPPLIVEFAARLEKAEIDEDTATFAADACRAAHLYAEFFAALAKRLETQEEQQL